MFDMFLAPFHPVVTTLFGVSQPLRIYTCLISFKLPKDAAIMVNLSVLYDSVYIIPICNLPYSYDFSHN